MYEIAWRCLATCGIETPHMATSGLICGQQRDKSNSFSLGWVPRLLVVRVGPAVSLGYSLNICEMGTLSQGLSGYCKAEADFADEVCGSICVRWFDGNQTYCFSHAHFVVKGGVVLVPIHWHLGDLAIRPGVYTVYLEG